MANVWNGLQSLVEGWSIGAIITRLVIAMIVGIVIGFNREMKNRGAGIKTHVLVCVGAALTMMTGQYIVMQFPSSGVDMSRIGAQVVSGVGFLGVGTIIVTGKNHVRGLTTAAGLWASACAGLAIGIGFLEGTLIALVIILFTLLVLDRLDRWAHKHGTYYDYYIEFVDNRGITDFIHYLQENNIRYTNFVLTKGNGQNDGPVITLTLQLKDETVRKAFFDHLDTCEKISFAQKM